MACIESKDIFQRPGTGTNCSNLKNGLWQSTIRVNYKIDKTSGRREDNLVIKRLSDGVIVYDAKFQIESKRGFGSFGTGTVISNEGGQEILEPGLRYQWRVDRYCTDGSVVSSSWKTFTMNEILYAPDENDFVSTKLNDTQVQLDFKRPFAGRQIKNKDSKQIIEIQYWIKGQKTSSVRNVRMQLSLGDDQSVTLSSLTPEKTYEIRMRSIIGFNQGLNQCNSAWSNVFNYENTDTPSPCGDVLNLTEQICISDDGDTLNLSWDAVGGASFYEVEVLNTTLNDPNFDYLETINSVNTSITITTNSLGNQVINGDDDFTLRVRAAGCSGGPGNYDTILVTGGTWTCPPLDVQVTPGPFDDTEAEAALGFTGFPSGSTIYKLSFLKNLTTGVIEQQDVIIPGFVPPPIYLLTGLTPGHSYQVQFAVSCQGTPCGFVYTDHFFEASCLGQTNTIVLSDEDFSEYPCSTRLCFELGSPFSGDVTLHYRKVGDSSYMTKAFPGIVPDVPMCIDETDGVDINSTYEIYASYPCGTTGVVTTNILVQETVPCPEPFDLYMSDISVTTAKINWSVDENNIANINEFRVVVTKVSDGVVVDTLEPLVGAREATLTGLEGETEYNVTVETQCGQANSCQEFAYVGTESTNFRTLCGDILIGLAKLNC